MPTRKKTANPKTVRTGTKAEKLGPRGKAAARKAAEVLWDVGVTPHRLLQEVHELLLLRCLAEAQGNYALAAERFGPSRQSVQQFANSPLRDARWRAYQQNRRKPRAAPTEG